MDRNNVSNEFYYRGVENSSWGLEPSLMFNDLEWCEVQMVNEFKQLCPEEFENNNTFNVISKMQHHGLPYKVFNM